MIDQNGASESENKFETNHAMGGDLRSTHGSTPRTSDTGDATATNQKLDGNADSDVNPEFVNPEFDENPGMGFGFTERPKFSRSDFQAKTMERTTTGQPNSPQQAITSMQSMEVSRVLLEGTIATRQKQLPTLKMPLLPTRAPRCAISIDLQTKPRLSMAKTTRSRIAVRSQSNSSS
jgi:hypothetical protein